MPALIQDLLYPFRGGALFVSLAFALLFSGLVVVARHTGVFALYSLPLWLLFAASFLHYCFAIGERAADGNLDAPPAGFTQLGPFRLKPLLFLFTLGAAFSALRALLEPLSASLILAVIAPAMAGAFIGHRAMTFQLNPLSWLRVATRLGIRYVAMVGLLLPLILALVYLPGNVALPLLLFLVMACLVGLFFGLGRILYLGREELGIESDGSEAERESRAAEKREAAGFRARVADWHRLHTRGRFEDAADVAQAWLEANGAGVEEWERVLYALLEWQDTRTAALFLPRLVEKLAGLKKLSRAYAHYQAVWDRHGPVPLQSDTSLYRMAQLAKTAGRSDIAARLLKNLPHLFPASPLVGTARYELQALQREARRAGD